MRLSMQFYCLNMFRAPICPSSGVKLVNIFRFLGGHAAQRMWPGWPHPLRSVHPMKPSVAQPRRLTTYGHLKGRRYSLIVLLMMGILVPETRWGTAYFVASSSFFTFSNQWFAATTIETQHTVQIRIAVLGYVAQTSLLFVTFLQAHAT
jgi:hypothetical protein